MSRRLAALLGCFTVLSLTAAACGGDDDGGDDAASETTAAEVVETTEAAPADTAADTTEASDAAETTVADDSEAPAGDVFANYEDPRGGVFAEYAASFVRDDPFSSLDEFCVSHEPAAELTDTDAGITAEAITLVHLRSRLEQLEGIGFAVPIGDPAAAFQAFADYVNENCGGVRGRQIDLQLVEVDAYNPAEDIDALRNQACIQATEDVPGVIIMNSTGFSGTATLCIVEEHETAFISTQGNPDEFAERSGGRLLSLSPTFGEMVRWMASYAIDNGLLEGKTIGVVAADTPGDAESVEQFLVEPLREAGYNVAAFDIIGCQGTTTCTQGIQESVTNMLDAGVDVMFPGLNVVSLPQYLAEMVTQGFEPGDVQFFNSDFNSQAGELVSSKVVSFGGADAGALYNGAIIIDDADSGGFRSPDFEERPFNAMCYETVSAATGVEYDVLDPNENGPYGMIATICAEMRAALRAIYAAGDNPTRVEIYDALANLGPIDSGSMIPWSFTTGKSSAPDVIHTMEWTSPCAVEGKGFGTENICFVPAEGDEWVPAPRD